MNRFLAGALALALGVAVGCEQKSGTAPSTNPNKPNETRKITLTVSGDQTITQGETDEVTVNVSRTNNKDDVTLEVSDLPKGVTLDSKDVVVRGDQGSMNLRLRADPTALPVDNHVFHITGTAKDIKTDVLNVKLTVKAKK